MQIVPLGGQEMVRERGLARAAAAAVAPSPRAHGAPAVVPLAPVVAGASSAPRGQGASGPPLQAGVADWDPDRNAQTSGAQQATLFLDRLGVRLQSLKSDLGSAVAGADVAPERLARQRDAVTQLWHSRASQAGGQLDARLAFNADAPATQGFAIRGLDTSANPTTDRETLALSLGTPTPARPAALVLLEPGLDAPTLARRFGQALAPMGIGVTVGEDQGLRFAVPEAQWPAVRDTLSIRGEGRRFPTGLFHRVRTAVEPAAISPDTWSVETGPAGRQTLQRIVEAQRQVKLAGDAARATLQQTGRTLDAAAAAKDAGWAQRYATGFAAATQPADSGRGEDAGQPLYPAISAIGAALPRVSRQRVLTLLSGDR